MFAASGPIFAQSMNWQPTTGMYGGRIFMIREAYAGVLFASAEHDGLKRSIDDGQTWQATNLTSETLRQLVAAPDGTLYASQYTGDIFMSTDSGRVWTNITLDPGAAYAIECIAVSPEGHLLAGSFYYGVYRTQDRGDTWEHFPLSFSYWPTPIRMVAAPLPGILFFYADDDGLFRSIDNGVSWQKIYDPYGQVISLERLPDGRLMMNSIYYTYWSSDMGTTWTSVSHGISTPFGCTAWDGGTQLLAGSSDGPIRSSDLGDTWQKFVTPSRNTRMLSACITSTGTYLAGSDGDGIWRSTDAGLTWANATIGITGISFQHFFQRNDGLLFATGGGGPFSSTDGGLTWKTLRSAPATGEAVFAADGSLIVAYNESLLRSTDDGNTFELVGGSGSGSWVTAMCRDSSGRLYAGTYNSILRSDDHGQTWTSSPVPFGNHVWRMIATRERVFVSVYGNGIFGTADRGDHWQQVNRSLPYQIMYGLAVSSNGDLYAGAANGSIARLMRGAAGWELRSTLPTAIWELLMDEGDRLYAATNNGVWLSTDLGLTWQDQSQGLTNLRVAGLAFNDRRELLAGQEDGGVMISQEPLPRVVPTTTQMLHAYPNPFNNQTIVQVRLPRPMELTLRLVDILGREVAVFFQGSAQTGEFLVSLNGSTLASGIYFVILDADGTRQWHKVTLLR